MDDVAPLIDFMYWVNDRLLEAAERLSNEAYLASAGPTQRDLRSTLVHELDVEWSWRLALQGKTMEEMGEELSAEDYPDVAALRDRWRRDEAEMRAWLAGFSEDDLAAEVTPVLTRRPLPLWQYLLHIVFHAAQQQADAATILTMAAESPGDIGYLEWLRSGERSA